MEDLEEISKAVFQERKALGIGYWLIFNLNPATRQSLVAGFRCHENLLPRFTKNRECSPMPLWYSRGEAFACLGMNACMPVIANASPLRFQKTKVLPNRNVEC